MDGRMVCILFTPHHLTHLTSQPHHRHHNRVNKKYRLSRKIGSGSFGDIYLGVNVTTGEEVRDWRVMMSWCILCLCGWV